MHLIGQNIKVLRQTYGLSRSQLADLSGVPFSTLSDIENGKTASPGGPVLQRIADGLSQRAGRVITTDELLRGTGGDESPSAGVNMALFWRIRFAELGPQGNWAQSSWTPQERIRWAIQQMVERLPGRYVADLLEVSPGDLAAMAEGDFHVSESLIGKLVTSCRLSYNWITVGAPVTVDEDLQFLLSHRDGPGLIRVARRALEHHMMPEQLDRLVTTLLELQNNEKPPA